MGWAREAGVGHSDVAFNGDHALTIGIYGVFAQHTAEFTLCHKC